MRVAAYLTVGLALLAVAAVPPPSAPPPDPVPAVSHDTIPDDSTVVMKAYGLVADTEHAYACATVETTDGQVGLARPVLHFNGQTTAVSVVRTIPGIETCTRLLAQHAVRLTTPRWKTVAWDTEGLLRQYTVPKKPPRLITT
jgi:hypothetical protein